MRSAKLKLVEPDRIDIYAADRAKIASIDWAQVHINGDRARPLNLPERTRRFFRIGGGVRNERGGWKFEERA